jgi:DegV family protein with EDD domain
MTKAVGFITDSTSDIPAEEASKYGVDVVPVMIMFGGQALRDGVDISRSELYRRMTTQGILPTTAAPAVGSFEEAFESMLSRGYEKILSIHPANTLSGIYNSAHTAAASFPGRVETLESGTISMGTGFQLLAAAEAAEHGAPIETLVQTIQKVRRRVRVVALIESLTHLAHSGRVSSVFAGIGNFLQIKILIDLREGIVSRAGQVRTHTRGINALIEQVRSWGPLERLAVAHANARQIADALIPQLAETVQVLNLPPKEKTHLVEVTPAIGIHIGPGAVGVIAVSAQSPS